MLCQTTDSGSNNNTLAEYMHQDLQSVADILESGYSWDSQTMHIKCFCHKMALVVNAGLNELGLDAPPPPKLKKAFLGSFPYSNLKMEAIVEEDEHSGDSVVDDDETDTEPDPDEPTMKDSDDEDDCEDNISEEFSQSSKTKNKSATNRNLANELNDLTKAASFFFPVLKRYELSFDQCFYTAGLCCEENHQFMCVATRI